MFETRSSESAGAGKVRSTGSDEGVEELKRVLLPTDLPGALRHLNHDQLDALRRAVNAELGRRGLLLAQARTDTTKVRAEKPVKARVGMAQSVPPGKANLIRAAAKAGMKPTAISRELGVSLSVVRQILASSK